MNSRKFPVRRLAALCSIAALASVSAPAFADQVFTTSGASADFTVNSNGTITLVLSDTATTEIYTLSLHDALPILSLSTRVIVPLLFTVKSAEAPLVER